MKIQCPQCDTTYDVSEEVANSDAQVQCAKCEHVFTATPVPEVNVAPEMVFEPEVEAEAAPEMAIEPEVEAEATPEMAVEPEVEAEITLDPIAEPEGSSDLLTDDEKEFFSSFGTKIAEEEANQAEQTAEPEPEPEPIMSDGDIGWVDTKEEPQPEPEGAEPDKFEAVASPDDEDLFADADAETSFDSEPVAEPVSDVDNVVPLDKAASDPIPSRFSRKILMGWGALAASLLLLIIGTTLLRVPIVKALPGMAGLYQKVGYSVNIRGLEFHGMTHQWINKGGRVRLVVRGEIANVTGSAVPVPEIIFVMLDSSGHEFFQWTERMKISQLAANTRARFFAQIPAPADRVRQLKIRFAKR